ncbi:MAG: cupin domain-containing protein [Silvibacterium sp.]|jgi:1,2-dihydroxy-3-keto-5-methylthiopentene dioxygenase
MAVIEIPDEKVTLREENQVRDYLAHIHIDYEQWDLKRVPPNASPEELLREYTPEISALKQKGGYTTADVIDVQPETPGLEAMLARFNREHWHHEDEVRFIVRGRGLFHIHPEGRPVVVVEVTAGDLIRVPKGTRHWFNLCSDRDIRAIRLFQAAGGWTPHYTSSGIDAGYEPVCFGPVYLNATRPAITHG